MGPLLSWTASRLVRRTVPDVHAPWGERPTHAAVGGFLVLQRPQGGSTGGAPHSSRGSLPSWRRCDLRVGVRVGGWGGWLTLGVRPGAGAIAGRAEGAGRGSWCVGCVGPAVVGDAAGRGVSTRWKGEEQCKGGLTRSLERLGVMSADCKVK